VAGVSVTLTNAAIADALEELGDLYELDGAIVHRVVAYRTAARSIREAPTAVAELARAGRATGLPGVGSTIQEKVLALLENGTIPAAEKLRARFPPGLLALRRLPGVGPKRARLLYDSLGIDSLEALREAALAQRLRTVKALGERFETAVLEALAAGAGERAAAPRVLLPTATSLGEQIVAELRERLPGPLRIELAGSCRRRADSVKDLDIVVAYEHPERLGDALAELELIEQVGSRGEAGARARTHTGMPIDLRVVDSDRFGTLLQHLTGSGRHNAAMREDAVRRGLHVSEYAVAGPDGEIRCATEEKVYAQLGLAWIPPELREDRGELSAARLADGAGLPTLLELEDLRGDLHCHTIASDGRNTIDEMAAAARAHGYEYLAITDHSASHGFGNDVSPDELRRQIERVRAAGERHEGLQLLAGSEVNILPDGSLDYEDELLAELDWVVASVHTSFRMGEQAMTERVLTALEHPYVDALGHPTGRKIGSREPYAIDVQAVIAAAVRTGTMLEINANPDRRDLNDLHARAAAAAGALLLVDSDAHGAETLANIQWGVATARRAWCTAAQVANTRGWADFAPLRKRARQP
jgi:DNA polymerase (family 10)